MRWYKIMLTIISQSPSETWNKSVKFSQGDIKHLNICEIMTTENPSNEEIVASIIKISKSFLMLTMEWNKKIFLHTLRQRLKCTLLIHIYFFCNC